MSVGVAAALFVELSNVGVWLGKSSVYVFMDMYTVAVMVSRS